MPYKGSGFELLGTVFSKVVPEKNKMDGKTYEKIVNIIGELIPSGISMGCTASKLSIPIPDSPPVRIRMGFQGPTLQIVAYLHTYDRYEGSNSYGKITMSNWYNAWKNDVKIEDLIKVSCEGDSPAPIGYGDPVDMDGAGELSNEIKKGWSAIPHLKPGTYWWVRKRDIIREAGWVDKFKLELDLERCWQWSSTGRQRPAWDVDCMECFKEGENGYRKLITEHKEGA